MAMQIPIDTRGQVAACHSFYTKTLPHLYNQNNRISKLPSISSFNIQLSAKRMSEYFVSLGVWTPCPVHLVADTT